MAELISIVVSTYNREDALDAVLRTLAGQADRDFEVVVADDGSGEATTELVQRWQSRLGVALKHVRHDKNGFRLAEIRNRAIRASAGSYCIFLDGDCLAPPDFVGRHRSLAEQGWFVAGNRALLSRDLTETVLSQHLAVERFRIAWWATRWLSRRVNRLIPLLRLPDGRLRKLRPRAWQAARSCNLAVWRSDLELVDGFDATFSGWGREDSDLLVRLIRAGVRRKDGACSTGVIHLWHPDADRSKLLNNDRHLEQVIASDRVRAERGMSWLAASAES